MLLLRERWRCKTTTSAAIATGPSITWLKNSRDIDFDVGLRNLDLIMGCERRVVYDVINVINREANLQQALIKDKRIDNLYILPASQTRDKDALTKDGVERIQLSCKKILIILFAIHQLVLSVAHYSHYILLIKLLL